MQLGRDAEAEYFLSGILDRAPDDYDGPARGREIVFQAYDDLIGYFEKKGRDRRVDALARSACSRPLAPTRFARRLAARFEERGKPDEAAAWMEKAIAGSDPLEDPLELSDSALALSRLRSAAGKRRMAEGSAWAGALRLAAERIASCPFGIAHYRLARAQSLARDIDAAIASLEQARRSGSLPPERLAEEGDFEPLRKEPAFQALLGR